VNAYYVVIAAGPVATYLLGRWSGSRSERDLTAHLFQESAQEHDRLARQLEQVRRQLAAAVVRAVDEP
jgi:hypothetical protein